MRGFKQKPGVDYTKEFAPVRLEIVRLVIALASRNGWALFHMDVKSTFLNGFLDQMVYVTQPPDFEIKGKERMVYKLNKALYGLKQAPKAWNKRIDSFLIQNEFTKCTMEYGVYVKRKTEGILLICLYVDDLLVSGSNSEEIEKFKTKMMTEFENSDLGKLSYFLGMEFLKIS